VVIVGQAREVGAPQRRDFEVEHRSMAGVDDLEASVASRSIEGTQVMDRALEWSVDELLGQDAIDAPKRRAQHLVASMEIL
jgi:hypothetical protein